MADVLQPVPPFEDVPHELLPRGAARGLRRIARRRDGYVYEIDVGKNRDWERSDSPAVVTAGPPMSADADPADPHSGRPRRAGGSAGGSRHPARLAEAAEGERVSLGDMVDAFDARAYGPLIVLFAAPNVLPVALPGISAVLGAPLILLTAQLMIGLRRPWLPGFLRRRSLARIELRVAGRRIVPRLHRHRADDPAAAPAADRRLAASG